MLTFCKKPGVITLKAIKSRLMNYPAAEHRGIHGN